MAAAKYGHTVSVDILLQRGANPDLQNQVSVEPKQHNSNLLTMYVEWTDCTNGSSS